MINLITGPEPATAPRERKAEDPFEILVAGDFSGRESRGVLEPLAGRKPLLVDRDNFDEVLARLQPDLWLKQEPPAKGPQMTFRSLEDFHPDALYARYPRLFEAPQAMAAAPAAALAAVASTGVPRTGASVLDELIAESDSMPVPVPQPGELQDFIDRVTAPHLARKPTAQETQRAEQTRDAAATAMRALLHHRAFQALEAAWRGLFFLVRRLETDEHLKIYLLDASRAELAEAVQAGSLPAVLAGRKWAAIAGIYRFGRSSAEVRLLDRLGRVAQALGAAWLAESGVPGDGDEDRDAWEQLRRAPHARNIGMILPRFLLRHPYGNHGESVESFAFEEMDAEPVHEHYLWGNPALAVALLLGQAFEEEGWDMHPGAVLNIDKLPLHAYRSQGESLMKPCAEVWMTEMDAAMLLAEGIMPLASLKNSDSVRLVRFQSIAEPAARLAGPWES